MATREVDTDTGCDDDDAMMEYIPDWDEEEELLQEDDHILDQSFLFSLPKKKAKVSSMMTKKKQDQEPSSDPLADQLENKFGLANNHLFYQQKMCLKNCPLLPVNLTVLRIVDPQEKLLSRHIVSTV